MRQEQGHTAWVGTDAAAPRLTCADSGRDWQMLLAQRMSALEDSNARVLSALKLLARDKGGSGVNDALEHGPTQQQGWAPETVLDILFRK